MYSEYMKRKAFEILFLVISFVVVAPRFSFAQGIVPSGFPQPGVSCGNARGVGDVLKCCKNVVVTPGKLDLGNPVLNGAQDLIKPIIDSLSNPIMLMQKSVNIKPCIEGDPSTPGDISNDSCICLLNKTKDPLSVFDPICDRIKDKSEVDACKVCANTDAGVWTALGCFNGNVSEFIANNIMRTSIGIAGGISLLCIMLAAFQMQTSAGNAEKVKKAQELLTNCITGLMVIIFSILILKIIGVDILRIPGFN